VKFDHNLDEIPIQIKSNTPKGTKETYVWLKGTIRNSVERKNAKNNKSVSEFSMVINMEDYSAWFGFCNGPGEVFFNPEPKTSEVVWTFFKTSKEMVIECNGVFCLKYSFSNASKNDPRCATFNQPSVQMLFEDNDGQVAKQYRISGIFK
jgi:hypothetical protein